MSGNTGKLTARELRARGPRMKLASITITRHHMSLDKPPLKVGFVIFREDHVPFKQPYWFGWIGTMATSFSLHYLLKIGASNK